MLVVSRLGKKWLSYKPKPDAHIWHICTQYPTGILVAIPVTARIRGFAGVPVPAKFHFFAGIPYRYFTPNLVIKTCQKIIFFSTKNLIKSI